MKLKKRYKVFTTTSTYTTYYLSFVSLQHNLVGRLLGPKGLTLKRMQAETRTRMSILGRGSMRDRRKEEELRNTDDPTNQHLNDDLHVLVQSEPPYSSSKLAAGVAEVKKMLIPLVSVRRVLNWSEILM